MVGTGGSFQIGKFNGEDVADGNIKSYLRSHFIVHKAVHPCEEILQQSLGWSGARSIE